MTHRIDRSRLDNLRAVSDRETAALDAALERSQIATRHADRLRAEIAGLERHIDSNRAPQRTEIAHKQAELAEVTKSLTTISDELDRLRDQNKAAITLRRRCQTWLSDNARGVL